MLRNAVAGTFAAFVVAACSTGGDAPQSGQPATPAEAARTAAARVEECPELPERCTAVTAWVSRVIDRADHRVAGDTGSALIAAGAARQSFYVWATKVDDGVPCERRRWPSLGVLSNVRLYGRAEQRWWLTQGFVFFVRAGPFQHSILPGNRGVSRLIEASRAVAAPKTQGRG